MKNVLFFDLDGTLTDSGLGIMNSTSYALKKLGIIEDRVSVLKTFVGPPIMEHAEELYGLSKEDSKKLIDYYREYFVVKGMYENSVYEGIDKTLKSLKKYGAHTIFDIPLKYLVDDYFNILFYDRKKLMR